MEFRASELQAVILKYLSRSWGGCIFRQICSDAGTRLSMRESLTNHQARALIEDPDFRERVRVAIFLLMYDEKIRESFEEDIVRYRCV